MIEVLKAPPFATIQDRGWRTGRAFGLPEGGAMDRESLERANALAGNPPDTAAIEWALGPGTLRCEEDARIVVCGAGDARLEGHSLPREGDATVVRVPAGATLTLAPDPRRRFLYVAVRGGFDVPMVLGSRSTYLPGGFGGHEGRRLRNGDRLPIGHPGPATPGNPAPGTAGPPDGVLALGVTRGPQWERFDAAARTAFFGARYTVSNHSDRMGYRLQGPPVAPTGQATLPSEAACPGAVQVPDGGEPIVLMPDGPTVGGYPKLVVVRRADLGRLAQCLPGAAVRFIAPP